MKPPYDGKKDKRGRGQKEKTPKYKYGRKRKPQPDGPSARKKTKSQANVIRKPHCKIELRVYGHGSLKGKVLEGRIKTTPKN